jgi:outer membrane immunogenic protein
VSKRVLLAVASTAPTSVASQPAAAAAAATPPAAASSSFRWTGFYVGGHFGQGMGNGNMIVSPLPSAAQFVNLGPTKLHPDPSGTILGGQGGFNWQRGPVVYGVEGDYSASDMNGIKVIRPIIQNNNTPFPGAAPGNNIVSHQDTDWISTVRARVGVTPNARLLIYGTGGLAYGHVTYFANTDFKPVGTENYPAFADKNKNGWCVGTGAEVGLATHFTARFEYLYYDLGNQILHANPNPPLPPFGIDYEWATSAQLLRGGFNFKF